MTVTWFRRWCQRKNTISNESTWFETINELRVCLCVLRYLYTSVRVRPSMYVRMRVCACVSVLMC